VNHLLQVAQKVLPADVVAAPRTEAELRGDCIRAAALHDRQLEQPGAAITKRASRGHETSRRTLQTQS
jgi:hypothetical protein